ncbi:hypothetical protein BJX76DRAFT_310099 [Aspergillus varians]
MESTIYHPETMSYEPPTRGGRIRLHNKHILSIPRLDNYIRQKCRPMRPSVEGGFQWLRDYRLTEQIELCMSRPSWIRGCFIPLLPIYSLVYFSTSRSSSIKPQPNALCLRSPPSGHYIQKIHTRASIPHASNKPNI